MKTSNDSVSTIRLIFPQWQGGVISGWMPELPSNDASRAYFLGAQLLNFLAPKNNQKIIEVPVSLDVTDRTLKNGISSYDVIVDQTQAALDLLKVNVPDRIITLGGDCAVSVAPFTYLMSKYSGEVAIVWIDAHSDLTLPGDEYQGFHAMALSVCLGFGDPMIMNMLPAKGDSSKTLIVGVRSWDKGIKERQEELGIKGLAPNETRDNSNLILDWLKKTGVSNVLIHFDLDVLDPSEIIAAVVAEPDGVKINEAVRIINDIASEYNILGLTIAEPIPRTAIKIKNMMNQLPLFQD